MAVELITLHRDLDGVYHFYPQFMCDHPAFPSTHIDTAALCVEQTNRLFKIPDRTREITMRITLGPHLGSKKIEYNRGYVTLPGSRDVRRWLIINVRTMIEHILGIDEGTFYVSVSWPDVNTSGNSLSTDTPLTADSPRAIEGETA